MPECILEIFLRVFSISFGFGSLQQHTCRLALSLVAHSRYLRNRHTHTALLPCFRQQNWSDKPASAAQGGQVPYCSLPSDKPRRAQWLNAYRRCSTARRFARTFGVCLARLCVIRLIRHCISEHCISTVSDRRRRNIAGASQR